MNVKPQTRFTNHRGVGKYADISFETEVQGEKKQRVPQRVRTKIHYFEAGQEHRRTLLLLHGTGQSAYFFAHNFEALSRHFRVILPDLPGHGYSGCPEMDYAIEDYSVALEALLQRLGIGQVFIVAYGQAAGYAADFCCYNPGRVQRMVFINPGAYENTRALYARQFCGPLGGYFAGRLARFSQGEKYWKHMLLDQTMLTDRDIEEFCRPFSRNGVRLCARLSALNYLEEDLEGAISALDCPVLVISGVDDAVSSRRDTQYFCDTIPDAYFMQVHGCGALPHFEKPAIVNKGISKFLLGKL